MTTSTIGHKETKIPRRHRVNLEEIESSTKLDREMRCLLGLEENVGFAPKSIGVLDSTIAPN